MEGGLAVALRHAVARLPGDVRADIQLDRRYSSEIEGAVYFCCTEALHNAYKHGGDGVHIGLSLDAVESELTFEVSDDGRGFEPSNPRKGVGFDNMTDRLGSIAGRPEMSSSVGAGTRVRGVVPVDHPADGPAPLACPTAVR